LKKFEKAPDTDLGTTDSTAPTPKRRRKTKQPRQILADDSSSSESGTDLSSTHLQFNLSEPTYSTRK